MCVLWKFARYGGLLWRSILKLRSPLFCLSTREIIYVGESVLMVVKHNPLEYQLFKTPNTHPHTEHNCQLISQRNKYKI